MTTTNLPPDLARRWGNLHHIARRGPNQWSSECPKCGQSGHEPRSGKPDRFQMWADGRPRGWCRRCLYFDFADGRQPFSDEERLEYETRRRQLAEKEVYRLQSKLEWFRSTHQWTIYHDQMTERERQAWRNEGIPDSIQDWLRLGYVPDRTFYQGDTPIVSDAMTIPYFGPAWAASTMQYRLLNPPDPDDRYRFQAGLPVSLYLTDPDSKPKGPCILAEGAKKGIVGMMYLHDRLGGPVVASPSKTPRLESLDILEDCSPIYIVYDPDATTDQIRRTANYLGPERVRVVCLPVKLDDAFVQYKAAAPDIWPFFQVARPALSL